MKSKTTFAQLTILCSWPSTYIILSPLSSHFTKQTVKFYRSKRCRFKYVAIIHSTTASQSSLSCRLAFYGIPIFHTFLIRRYYCLLSFFTAFTCMVCNIFLAISPLKKSNISGLKLLPQMFCRHSHYISAPSFIVRGPIIIGTDTI